MCASDSERARDCVTEGGWGQTRHDTQQQHTKHTSSHAATTQPNTKPDAADNGALSDKILELVYGGRPAMRPHAELFARHLLRQRACMAATPAEALFKGHVRFDVDVVKR